MKETPVVRVNVVETPVIRPKNFREDAFFNHPENFNFLLGHREEAELDNDIASTSSYPQRLMSVLTVAVLILSFGPFFGFSISVLVGGVVALVLTGAVGLFVVHERAMERKTSEVTRRLYTQGKILEGKVVTCISSMEGGRYSHFYVDTLYRFNPPTGDPIQDHVKRERDDLNGTVLPTQGTPVYILYFDPTEYYWL